MDIELIKSHRDNKKLMPYLHLPVQSGSDNILKMMNRKHSVKEYLNIVEKVRDYNPKIAISGDFIVGFPGETDKDHLSTLNLIKQVNYAQAYSFKYSKRPGTPGSILPNHVNEDIKNSRLYEVQELLRSQQLSFNTKTINSTMKVLVLKKGKKKNQYIGRSPFNQSVYFSSKNENLIGSFIDLYITEAFQNSLTGVIVTDFQ
jgi:tRNA-2-methylthio-N6-dimethylallyladenosine synthase